MWVNSIQSVSKTLVMLTLSLISGPFKLQFLEDYSGTNCLYQLTEAGVWQVHGKFSRWNSYWEEVMDCRCLSQFHHPIGTGRVPSLNYSTGNGHAPMSYYPLQ